MNPATFAAGLILISALANALVGAVLKRSHDKLVLRGILGATSVGLALPVALSLPPLPANVWVVLWVGVGVHWIYHIAQAAAFTRGDMSVVYPVMRGFAPALTAVFAFLFLKESLTAIECLGLGIVVMSLVGFGWPGREKIAGAKAALLFAVACGSLTAIYTVIDAYGARLAPVKFSFIAWFFVVEGIGISVIVSLWKRKGLRDRIALDWRGGMIAGGLGVLTYTTALYAYSLAPVAPLAALRETSVVFGALLAAFWLKEDFGPRRILLSLILVAGLILMHLA